MALKYRTPQPLDRAGSEQGDSGMNPCPCAYSLPLLSLCGPFLNEDSQACALPSGSLLVLGADLRGLPPGLLWAPHGEKLGRDMKVGSGGREWGIRSLGFGSGGV